MLPTDAVTITGTITGNTTVLLKATSTNTILKIRGQQSGTASQSEIYCGATAVAINYGKDYSEQTLNYVCIDKPITIHKTGNDLHFYSVSIVPRNRNTEHDPVSENVLTFQEAMFIYCIILAILSISMWRFIFPKASEL